MRSTSMLALALIAGCGSQGGAGTLEVAASGEEAAVEGYPSSTGVAFADGWSLEWEHVLVSLDAFHVAHGGVRTPLEADPVIVNLHDAVLSELWSFPGLPAQRYEEVGYELAPPVAGARRVGAVTDAQAASMTRDGISLWLRGTAHHPDHHDVVLDLAFPMHTSLSDCVNAADATLGVLVAPNGTARHQITLHLDHVFLDSIVSVAPALRFEAFAAAADADFVVTLDSLASQPLADLRDVDGAPLLDETGSPVFYDPGSTPLAVQDLRSFVYHQASTVGHFDGEGHCAYVCLDASGAVEPSCPVPPRP